MTPLRVKAYLTEDQRHSKYLIKGLTQLRDSGEIELEFRAMPPMWKNRFVIKNGSGSRTGSDYPWSPELEISDGKRSVRVAIDLQDWTNYFSNHSIAHCSLIYKRALEEKEASLISRILGKQVLPFGPNHNESLEDQAALRAIAKASKNQNLVKALRNPGKVWSRLTNSGRKELRKDTPHEYISVEPPEHPYVFFQVQCHTWKDNSFASGLNEFRAELIRTFRRELGEKFVGGMFFSGPVDPEYADCITNVNPDPGNYKRFVEKASVLISTNGFGDSIPWKLTEYLKWGSCIVSQRPKHMFRAPVPEQAMKQFDTVDEALKQVRYLLDHPDQRDLMSEAAKNYYNTYVDPKESVLAVLKDALQHA